MTRETRKGAALTKETRADLLTRISDYILTEEFADATFIFGVLLLGIVATWFVVLAIGYYCC